MTRRSGFPAIVAAAVALLAAGCGGGGKSSAPETTSTIPAAEKPAKDAAPWPRPNDAMALAAAAGVPVGVYEYGVPGHPGKHIHAHLDVFVNGKRTPVPAGIGIDIPVPGVQHGTAPDGTPAYGGIRICARPCIAALHTHDDSGLLHIESQKPRPYTLGEVFTEWNERLDKMCVGGYCRPTDHVAVYVSGKPHTGNPAALVLQNLQEIAIVIGTPPSQIPNKF